MSTTKKVVIVAVIVFVLSFLIGLISSVSFGIVLLRAIICAVIFGALFYALSFVFQRFLVDGAGVSLDASGADSVVPQKGQLVDIKVEDTFLPEEENAPLFKIPKELMPNKETVSGSGVDEKIETAEAVGEVSSGEEKLFEVSQPKVLTPDPGATELGSLPDIDTMASDIQSSSSSEVITTSDFANSDGLVTSGELRGADKELMAKAIHTVLVRDND